MPLHRSITRPLLPLLALAGLAMAQAHAASAVSLGFPAPEAQVHNTTNNSDTTLGQGGRLAPGQYFTAGTRLSQTFAGTGLASVSQSRWRFSMTDRTWADTTNSFYLEINGETVGQFSFAGNPAVPTRQFDIALDHQTILGDSYTLAMVAVGSVRSGAGSWNWMPGGTVDLTAPVPEPATAALMLAGLACAGLVRRRASLPCGPVTSVAR